VIERAAGRSPAPHPNRHLSWRPIPCSGYCAATWSMRHAENVSAGRDQAQERAGRADPERDAAWARLRGRSRRGGGRGFQARPPRPGGRRSGLCAQCAPAGVATQPQPPRAQPAHAVPLRPPLCAPGAGPAVRQALPATARQPSDADASNIQQLLRCHAPSPLLAPPARWRRCAAPYELE
jgi:hypothetical protein